METVSKKVLETYKNIYLGPFLNKKEKFQASTSTTQNITTASSSKSSDDCDDYDDSYYPYDPLFTIIAYIIFFYAIYLSFRCNNGFSVWGFLGAFLFSPIYIIYKLTSTPNMCNYIK